MAIQNLPDQDLLKSTKALVSREREILTEVLKHLREIDRRRLFSSLGYKSLFEYAVRELSYSEDQAYRRLNAMRMLKEMPELEKQIENGNLSLSALSVANSLFKAEKCSVNRKREVLTALEGKSRREAEKIVLECTTLPKEALRPEAIRIRSETLEFCLIMAKEFEEKLEKVKGLLAHSHPGISTSQLFAKLCDDFLANDDKKKTAPPRKAASFAQIKRDVWQKAQGRCEKCGSQHALQYDHIKPRAIGGDNSRQNLRLLCRNCNQRAAIVNLGLTKMQLYLEG